ncbi:DnaJ domain-containing protein [Rhodomicrobium sp. R_RK_3]|uniref:DnaJ domain-containing protein n=1 Tax=Rhodomicrobium sp. R_RK_3 TaxID=2029567 RepID=UPI0014829253|nr:DnaJ domain-containing protein [Rhodomicrobium sp. R_RK_3]
MSLGAENYYDILGISENADDDQVKQAFRELAKYYHPDHNPGDAEAERSFKRINTAYEGLKDASRRQAYNEWLSFSDKREKAKRTQWGRLAAMVFLLLLGPSAALYWVVVVADIAVFDSAGDRPGALVSASQDHKPEPPAAVAAQPAPAAPPAKAETEDHDKALARAREAAAKVKPAAPAPSPAASALPAQPPAAARPPAPRVTAVEKPAAPQGQPQPPASRVAALDRPAPPPIQAPAPAPAAPAPVMPSLSERAAAAKRAELSGESGDVTQALPAQPPRISGLSDAEIARLEEEPPKYDPPGRSTAYDEEEGGARATARMLARLKEPDVAQPSAAAPETLAPPRKRPIPGSGEVSADAFSDCAKCPVMSLARRSAAPGEGSGLAISLSTITVAQWNACVADGICLPYRSGPRNSEDPVMNVSQREASAYADWLTGVTGQSYRVVAPLSGREASRDCNGRRKNGNWQWLDDGDRDADCEPSAGGSFESARGFRVARNVRPGG